MIGFIILFPFYKKIIILNKKTKEISTSSKIFLMNHSSYIDPMILAFYFNKLIYVPVGNLLNKGIIKIFFKFCTGGFFLPKKNEFVEFKQYLNQLIQNNNSFLVHPEGRLNHLYYSQKFDFGSCRLLKNDSSQYQLVSIKYEKNPTEKMMVKELFLREFLLYQKLLNINNGIIWQKSIKRNFKILSQKYISSLFDKKYNIYIKFGDNIATEKINQMNHDFILNKMNLLGESIKIDYHFICNKIYHKIKNNNFKYDQVNIKSLSYKDKSILKEHFFNIKNDDLFLSFQDLKKIIYYSSHHSIDSFKDFQLNILNFLKVDEIFIKNSKLIIKNNIYYLNYNDVCVEI